jgi:hypothetical protein
MNRLEFNATPLAREQGAQRSQDAKIFPERGCVPPGGTSRSSFSKPAC